MICEILFEAKAKRHQIKTQSAQKRVLNNYCLTNSWKL